MRAAVEHVHHRHRQGDRLLAAEVAPERQAGGGGRGVGGRERDAEHRVRAEARLVRRPVELDQAPVERLLVAAVAADQRARDLVVDVGHRPRDALAAVGRSAVAQLGRLELAGRGPRRDRGAPAGAARQHQLDLDRGVAATVEDLPCGELLDRAHRGPPVVSTASRKRLVARRSASSGSTSSARAQRTSTNSSSPSASKRSSVAASCASRARHACACSNGARRLGVGATLDLRGERQRRQVLGHIREQAARAPRPRSCA